MIDGHMHLEYGDLNKEYVLKFVDAAVKKGLTKIQILDHTHRFKEFEEIYPELYDGSVCICSSAGCKGAGAREPDRGDTECHDSFMDTGK